MYGIYSMVDFYEEFYEVAMEKNLGVVLFSYPSF